MIVVVCPNLSLDVTLDVETLTPGDVHRARRSHRQAGGKGVNVVRAIRALGEQALLLGFVGGRHGVEIRERLNDESIEANLIGIEGDSRTCTIVCEPNGTATVINERGPHIDADLHGSDLIEPLRRIVDDASAIALMGSLPPGLPTSVYADMVELAKRRETFCLVDTSGNALRDVLSMGPDAVKPNAAEASALLGRDLGDEAACAGAVRELCRAGALSAMVTRGADGVVFSHVDTVAHGRSEPTVDIRYGNATGAGDALAAGLLVGHVRGLTRHDAVRLGVAAATASLAQGYGRFRPKDVRLEAVRIETLD